MKKIIIYIYSQFFFVKKEGFELFVNKIRKKIFMCNDYIFPKIEQRLVLRELITKAKDKVGRFV